MLIGTAGVLMVRPHVAICVFAGLGLMMILILTQLRKHRRPIIPVLALLVFVVAGNVVMSRTSSYLGTPSLTQEDVTNTLNSTKRTARRVIPSSTRSGSTIRSSSPMQS